MPRFPVNNGPSGPIFTQNRLPTPKVQSPGAPSPVPLGGVLKGNAPDQQSPVAQPDPAAGNAINVAQGGAMKAAGNVSGGAAPQAQGVGTGYVNLSSILAANAGSADQMASNVYAGAQEKNKAQQQGVAQNWDAQQNDQNLGSMSGLQAILQGQYGKSSQPYTEGGSALDAYLAGEAGGTTGSGLFKQAQDAYKPLSTVLSTPTPSKPNPGAAGVNLPGAPNKKDPRPYTNYNWKYQP